MYKKLQNLTKDMHSFTKVQVKFNNPCYYMSRNQLCSGDDVMNMRKYFEQSMMALLERKDIDSITVREIIEDVGSCRGTFYKNYIDKYYLCSTCIQNHIYCEISADADTWEDFIMQCLNVFEKNGKIILHAFKSKDVNSARHYHEKFTTEYLVKQYMKNGGDKSTTLNLLSLKFYSALVTELLVKWLADDCKESKDDVCRLICAVAPQMVFKEVSIRTA